MDSMLLEPRFLCHHPANTVHRLRDLLLSLWFLWPKAEHIHTARWLSHRRTNVRTWHANTNSNLQRYNRTLYMYIVHTVWCVVVCFTLPTERRRVHLIFSVRIFEHGTAHSDTRAMCVRTRPYLGHKPFLSGRASRVTKRLCRALRKRHIFWLAPWTL